MPLLAPTADYTFDVKFYMRSPLRNLFFKFIAITFGLDILFWGLILVAGWQRLTLQAIFDMGFVIIYLGSIFFMGLRFHEQIRLLFETGQIAKLEKGSPLDKVLGAATNMLLGGLFGTFLLGAFCLVGLGQQLFRH